MLETIKYTLINHKRIAVWKNEDKKDGSTYLSGSIFGIKFYLRANDKREPDSNQPHSHLSFAAPKDQGQQSNPQGSNEQIPF